MNPSTEDILDAAAKVNADTVFFKVYTLAELSNPHPKTNIAMIISISFFKGEKLPFIVIHVVSTKIIITGKIQIKLIGTKKATIINKQFIKKNSTNKTTEKKVSCSNKCLETMMIITETGKFIIFPTIINGLIAVNSP